MGSISEERIRNIKSSKEKKMNVDNNTINNFQNNPKLDIEAKDNFNKIFTNFYKCSKKISYSIINNSNNIINIDKETKIEKNEDNSDDINYILYKDNKSYDFGHDFFHNNIESKSLNKNDYFNNVIESNSSKEKISEKSDYSDISQSMLLFKNQIKIHLKKDIYGNETILRNSYYYNLIVKNIWHPFIKKKRYNTLFFFDWDDTLLCTSYIMPILKSHFSQENINYIKKNLINLDENVSKLLKYTLSKGSVFIISNSSPGWIEYSSVCFMPLTAKLLTNIKIISCKCLYSKYFPGDKKQWKIKAFKYAIESSNINNKLISNIICFGDSIIDLEAIQSLNNIFCNAYIKIIKFKENPHPIQLEKQIFLVNSQIDFIVNKVKNITLKVFKKKID